MNNLDQQRGFTIVELMIATTVFSVILLLCTFSLLQIGRTYYKGITQAKTQETARTVIDEIAQAIQLGGGTLTATTSRTDNISGTNYITYGFCIDTRQYAYRLDAQLTDNAPSGDQSRNALVTSEIGCTSLQSLAPGSIPSGRELLSPRMRLAKLAVTDMGNNLYQVSVRIVYGDTDLLVSPSHDACQVNTAGTQFCAVSELTTVVQKRI